MTIAGEQLIAGAWLGAKVWDWTAVRLTMAVLLVAVLSLTCNIVTAVQIIGFVVWRVNRTGVVLGSSARDGFILSKGEIVDTVSNGIVYENGRWFMQCGSSGRKPTLYGFRYEDEEGQPIKTSSSVSADVSGKGKSPIVAGALLGLDAPAE